MRQPPSSAADRHS